MSQYLDKYHPRDTLSEYFVEDRQIEDSSEVFALWHDLVKMVRVQNTSFLIIGKMLKTFRDQNLYKHLDYDTFAGFLSSDELGFSREKAYMCIKVYEYYIDHLQLDPERVGQMNISKLSMMVPVLKQLDDKKEIVRQIDDMSKLRHGDFVREIRSRVDKGGKPNVYWSDELGKWYVGVYDNTCHIHSLGIYEGTKTSSGT